MASRGETINASGNGVTRDDAQARRWFELAAQQNLAVAQYGLGMLYRDGRGVEKNLSQAYMWLELAASNGYVDAGQPLEAVSSQLSAEQRNAARQQSKEWRISNAKH